MATVVPRWHVLIQLSLISTQAAAQALTKVCDDLEKGQVKIFQRQFVLVFDIGYAKKLGLLFILIIDIHMIIQERQSWDVLL